jgi:ABC-type sulfate/molybdate transport systems ATPase subunit
MSGIDIQLGYRRSGFNLCLDMALPGNGVTAVLGPSGSGKTTLLRLIAGLERPACGHLRVGGKTWVDRRRGIFLTPQQRRVGMVFQDYALFAHMSVADNVGYSLPRRLRRQLVAEWLERLHLEPLAQRYPHQLSGGQRQRVALARALAREPDVLLLDEPFSAVDAYLRQRLRAQLLAVVAAFDRPVLLVTHDVEEARHAADRVAVIVDGRLHCSGETTAVFDHPRDLESARVLGWRNLLPVHALTQQQVSGTWGSVELPAEAAPDTAWLGIRPEHVRLHSPEEPGLPARVVRVTELGGLRELQCRLTDSTPLYLLRPWNEPLPAPGSHVHVELPPQHLRLLVEGQPDATRRMCPGELSGEVNAENQWGLTRLTR